MERIVRNAAKALIIKDDKMLAIKMEKKNGISCPAVDKMSRNFFRKQFAEKWQKKWECG